MDLVSHIFPHLWLSFRTLKHVRSLAMRSFEHEHELVASEPKVKH